MFGTSWDDAEAKKDRELAVVLEGILESSASDFEVPPGVVDMKNKRVLKAMAKQAKQTKARQVLSPIESKDPGDDPKSLVRSLDPRRQTDVARALRMVRSLRPKVSPPPVPSDAHLPSRPRSLVTALEAIRQYFEAIQLKRKAGIQPPPKVAPVSSAQAALDQKLRELQKKISVRPLTPAARAALQAVNASRYTPRAKMTESRRRRRRARR